VQTFEEEGAGAEEGPGVENGGAEVAIAMEGGAGSSSEWKVS
jgi:hypothetical protein